MITESSMYWLTRLDGIHEFARVATVVLSFVTTMAIVWFIIELCFNDDMGRNLVTSFCVAFATMIIFALLVGVILFVPTAKEMAAIKVIPRIANSQTVRDLGDGVAELARQWIDELKPSKVGK